MLLVVPQRLKRTQESARWCAVMIDGAVEFREKSKARCAQGNFTGGLSAPVNPFQFSAILYCRIFGIHSQEVYYRILEQKLFLIFEVLVSICN